MYRLMLMVFMLQAKPCCSVTVTLTGSAEYAVLGQTFVFTCHVLAAPKFGTVGFRREGLLKCIVAVADCIPTGDFPGYSCGCVNGQIGVFYTNISSVSIDKDDKTWTCERGSNRSNSIILPVYYGPFNNVTLDKSSPQRVTEFSTLTAVCSSTCKPTCRYTWRRGTVTVSSVRTLSLTNIDRNQAGDYICTATNTQTGTSATSTLTVDVQYKPVISGQHSSDPVIEFSTLRIDCSSYITPGNPSTTSFRWTGPKGSTHDGSVLSISNISRTQTGHYTCTASNTLTPTEGLPQTVTDTGEFTVDVQYPANITFLTINSKSNNVTVKESDNVTVKCEVDSNPGSTIRLMNGSRELSRAENSSSVEHSWTSDCRQRGNCTCVATNNIGSAGSVTKSVQVYILCSPREEESSSQDKQFYGVLGGIGRLSVTVVSYPKPTISWRQINDTSNRNLTSSSSVRQVSDVSVTASLTLTEIQQEDFGDYLVQADNGIGHPEYITVSLVSEATGTDIGLIVGVIIGVLVVLGITVAVIFVLLHRRRNNFGNEKEHITKRVDNQEENHVTSSNSEPQRITTGGDSYTVVTKDPKSGAMAVYAEVNKTKKKQEKAEKTEKGNKKKTKVAQKMPHLNKAYDNQDKSSSRKATGTRNADGLVYIDVEIKQSGSKPKVEIHEERTEYAGIQHGVVGPQLPDEEDEK